MISKIRSLSSKITGSKLFRNFFVLVGGSTLAQLIGLALTPLLSRIYSPEQFGILGSVMAIVGIVSLVGSLKYDMAIVLENDDEEVRHLQKLNVLVLSGVTVLLSLGILIFYLFQTKYLGNSSEFLSYVPYSIPVVFFSALYNIYYARYNREQEYKKMAMSQIIRRLSIISVQLIWALFSISTFGLIMGNVIGVIIPVVVILLLERNFFDFQFPNWHNIKRQALKHIDFPKYTTPQSLLNLFSGQLPVFLLAYYYDMATVGAFYFALKIVQMPAMFIGLSVRQIFYKECAKVMDNMIEMKNLYLKTTSGLFFALVLPMIAIFMYGEVIFSFVFGSTWEYAGILAGWMFLWYGTNIISGPSRSLFITLNDQKLALVFDIALFIVKALILIVIPLYYNAVTAIALISLVTVLSNLVSVVYWKMELPKRIIS